MVKFQGQAIDFAPARVATPKAPRMIAAIERSEPVESPQVVSYRAAPPKQEKVDLSEFIDRKAALAKRTAKMQNAQNAQKPQKPMRASLSRKHDLTDQRIGYAERR